MLEALALCVASVTDGDTFWTCSGDKVRLVAGSGPIDAPELRFQRGRWNDLWRPQMDAYFSAAN